MTNNIYSLFNRLSLRHGSVCVYPTDQFAVKAVTKDYERAQLQSDLNEIELVHVAVIDIETGTVTPVEHRIIPLKVLDNKELINIKSE